MSILVQTMDMIIFYILIIAYILAINFYAFLLVKTLRDEERQTEFINQDTQLINPPTENKPTQKYLKKLLLTGVLGGATTVYVCMFLLKYKRGDLLLMLLMPMLGVLNIYLFVSIFKNGPAFLLLS